jgi:hypothetical protein
MCHAHIMPTRAERMLKAIAGLAGLVTLLALALEFGRSGGGEVAAFAALGSLYATGVAYGLGDMARLHQRHKRRCRECLSGAGPHLRWWLPRVILVLVVAVLPVLLLLPVVGEGG